YIFRWRCERLLGIWGPENKCVVSTGRRRKRVLDNSSGVDLMNTAMRGLLVLGLLVLAGNGGPLAGEKKKALVGRGNGLQAKLHQPVNTDGFSRNTPLRDALGL